ncbi:hypothetical protein FP2506_13579 [Fulvimarina pelagi HTCC2506]|uniref:Uncharacterized protein n=1 Tax=Fulvimarina pelagi HTCC2506 TaxID=314231 RepID=Q0G4L4_9HYPH|nr:hypothetical protein FP2506_13579 [Fulvimarina pelagi HTCC2506]
MKTIRSATCRANPISCVTRTSVTPSPASPLMTSRTSPTISGSSADVGSSKSRMRGSMASARAMPTRCCWPPESWLGYFSACSAIPTRSSSLRARSRASFQDSLRTRTGPSATLSRIV